MIGSKDRMMNDWLLPFLFIFGRVILFLALIPNDLYGYGDLPKYFEVASLKGWPYFDYWVEYPPVFPFLNSAIYRLAFGQQFLYEFLSITIFSLAGGVGIWAFQQIARHLYGDKKSVIYTLVYFAFLAPLPYTWWYYELVPVCLVLLSLVWLLRGQELSTAVTVAVGILTKWFPFLLLPALWRYRSKDKALRITATSLGITIAVILALYIASPTWTSASLHSQTGRYSWQTLWALIDGNYYTGEYILLPERLDASVASSQRGEPAVIPPLLSLAVFGLIGVWFYLRVRRFDDLSLVAFIGITWGVFLLWSPGWSPQWILYLLPFALLGLPIEKGILWSLLLILITVIEWPVLLKRNLFALLWIVVPIRMAILAVLIANWYKRTRKVEAFTNAQLL